MVEFYVLAGRDLGQRFDLDHGATFGRGEGCDAVIRDGSVSREHARLERKGQRWFLVDLGSRNGLRARGARQERVELADELEVQLGKIPVRVRWGSASGGSPGPPASPRSPASPGPPADGFEIEDDIELGQRRGAGQAPEARGSRAGSPVPAQADAERARILSSTERTSLLSSDLSQLPGPLRWSFYVLALAVAGGLFWAVMRAVLFVRST